MRYSSHRLKRVAFLIIATLSISGAFAHKDHQEGAEPEVEIQLGEMYVRSAGGEPGDPIRFEAGELNLIRIVNNGTVEHELHAGRDPDLENRLYRENLFGMQGKHEAHGFLGVVLKPGEEARLHVWIPESRKGVWEMACFIAGHYEAGQKATLIIE